jgi:chromate transporter
MQVATDIGSGERRCEGMRSLTGNELAPPLPTFSEATRLWAKIGLLSFGGPAGQIALMHKELVDERRWISESRFLHALNFCMLLPGPEAQQLATYIGWLMHGWRGGVVAGLLFILPGFFIMLAMSAAYAVWGQTDWLSGLFFGLKAAVLAIVIEAVIRIGKRALKTSAMRLIALAAFLALFLLKAPFPLVILIAGIIGYVLHRIAYRSPASAIPGLPPDDDDQLGAGNRASPGKAAGTILVWGLLWIAPFAIILLAGHPGAYQDIGVFFSKMAVVTFGGAYAVLAYVAQQAVDYYHWLKPGEMLDGLALAETTPGPLVLVLTFVGFMAAFRDPGGLSPMLGGITGATLTTWVTFVPCFLWIFLGAPFIERLRENRALSSALTAISAAVTGVILNLAIWFAIHVLFERVDEVVIGPMTLSWPVWSSLSPAALALSLLSAVLLLRLKASIFLTLALCGALGWLASWLGLSHSLT